MNKPKYLTDSCFFLRNAKQFAFQKFASFKKFLFLCSHEKSQHRGCIPLCHNAILDITQAKDVFSHPPFELKCFAVYTRNLDNYIALEETC